ncbi:hypothetical protein C6P45_001227 [Maudiozyma exigua]|uniref:DNA damage-binding protein CMR1 n=1 Tax=Maudiozyma exigua TaxID=34358 RepID=A0A9P7B7A9_MAUEX|nr:hypothetical protein C6P45_001227 [Kazachstania exigua]
MNVLKLELNSGFLDARDVQTNIQRIEWEKLLENATQYSGPKNIYPLRNAFQRTTTIEINSYSNGRYYLAGTDDGSVTLWEFDSEIVKNTSNSNHESRLINKRLKVRKGKLSRKTASNSIVDGTIGTNENSTLIHSFETKYNKYRLYRGNSSQGSSVSTSANPQSAGRTISQETRPSQNHQFGITCIKWYGNDDGMFFTASHDKLIKIWDTNSFTVAQNIEFTYDVHQLDSVPSDLNSIFVASDDYYPRMIDLRSMNLGVTIFGKNNKNNKLTSMKSEILTCKCNPIRDNIVASGDNEGRIKLWDLRMRNNLLMELQHNENRFNNKAHSKSCNDLIWTEDGNRIISTGLDGKILKWEPFNISLIDAVTQIGETDPSRNKYRNRTSQRLLTYGKYLIMNTDYAELQIYDIEQSKFWNKIDYPTDLLDEDHGDDSLFCGISLQKDLTNSTGLRLLVGANNTHSTKSDLRNNILEFTC